MRFTITLFTTLILAAFFAISFALPSSAANDDDAKRISIEDAKTAFDAGDAVFVDARSADAYKTEHIRGAVNIPVAEFEKRYKELPKNKTIIVYCS